MQELAEDLKWHYQAMHAGKQSPARPAPVESRMPNANVMRESGIASAMLTDYPSGNFSPKRDENHTQYGDSPRPPASGTHRLPATKPVGKNEETKKNRTKWIFRGAIVCAILAFICAGGVLLQMCYTKLQEQNRQALAYSAAQDLLTEGKYDQAIEAFMALDGYRDSTALLERAQKEQKLASVVALENSSSFADAAMIYCRLGEKEKSYALWDKVAVRDSVGVGANNTLGLKTDGTVVAVGNNEYGQRDVSGWMDIVAISAGYEHTVGLKTDGTVVAVGNNEYGQCDVSGWTDIVAISAGYEHTVGLKTDGTVVAVGNNEYGQRDASRWTDIVAISAGNEHTVGLKTDGTVVAVGNNEYGQCDVSGWGDIKLPQISTERLAKLDVARQEQEAQYTEAQNLLTEGKYDQAIEVLVALDGYRDSTALLERAQKEQKLAPAAELEKDGRLVEAAMAYYCLGEKDLSFALWDATVGDSIGAGQEYTVGLKSDGTVVSAGKNSSDLYDVSSWTDIVAINAGYYHAVGLKADGTVVSAGRNDYGRRNVSGWKDIIAISAEGYHTVGLKADGTVVAVGSNDLGQCNVSSWKDIVAINAGGWHTAGLKADGTVMAVGWNKYGGCNVSGWTDIVAVSAGMFHTVGLKADGTVVAVGNNELGQCNVSGWKDIVAISAGKAHTVGLKADGTVVAVGGTASDELNVSNWTDIVAISAGGIHTVGLKADGTVVAVGYNGDGQCDVSDWKNIKLPTR